MELNNLVEFDSLKPEEEDEGAQWKEFCEDLKSDVLKGAYFIRKKDGRYHFGCTEEDKVGQERLLYRLKGVIEFYIQNYPDFEELKETAQIVGKPEEEVLAEQYELEEEDDG